MGMVYVTRFDKARLKDARLLSLLRIPVMATEERRNMILGTKKWGLNLQLFALNEMVAFSHDIEVSKNITTFMEVCFGRKLELMVKIITVCKQGL